MTLRFPTGRLQHLAAVFRFATFGFPQRWLFLLCMMTTLGTNSVTSSVANTVYRTLAPSDAPDAGQRAQIASEYGMFCHFGINTFLNVEWSDGTASPTNYCPPAVDADQWVRTAYLAGMRYVICITKHHDGFCMWPSAYTTYSVKYSGNTNDVVRLVSDACAKYGLKFAVYYSLWDRHEPSYTTNFNPGYISYMTNQLTELLSNYGPVCELWLDGSWDKPNTAWQIPVLYDVVKRLQPNCQMGINWPIGWPTNVDSGAAPSQQRDGFPIRYFPSDFRLDDPQMPVFPDPKLFSNPNVPADSPLHYPYYLPFEATITLSPSNTWFYKLGDDGAKSVATLEPMWDQCTAQSNRLVLNAPPDRNGILLPSNSNALVRLAYQLGIVPGRPFPVNLAEGCTATASSVWEDDTSHYGAALAVDADPNSRWASGPVGATNGWLAIDFGKPTKFNQVIIREYANRVQSFQLQAWDGAKWRNIANGTTIGASLRLDFSAITTRRLRLNILSSSDAPSIYMFKVHYISAKELP